MFKVTQARRMSNFDQPKSLPAPYLLNQIMDSGQTLWIVSLGQLKYLIRFGDRDQIFKDFDQTCTETPLGHGKEVVRFW